MDRDAKVRKGERKMFKMILVLLFAMAMVIQAAEPEPGFETAVLKRYNAQETKYLGCFLGPGDLQYNCSGSVPALVAESLNFDPYQFRAAGPVYTIVAKLSKPAPREQIDAMLGRFLREKVGVVYHLEKRPIKAEVLRVTSREILKNLPVSADPIPLAVEFHVPQIPIRRSWQYVQQLETFARVPYYKLRCTNITFRMLAQLLYDKYGTPVIDETGITSRFNIEFTKEHSEDLGGGLDKSEVARVLRGWGISLTHQNSFTDFIVLDRVADESKFLQ
jgi:uncharacterized protein (TIGR03435 family)